jgi:glycosyltransferase involved in cell wall biosynthesis
LTILYFSPSNAIGGAEISLIQTMTFMKKSGNRIILVLPPSSKTIFTDMALPVCDAIYFVKGMNWVSARNLSPMARLKQWIFSAYKSGGWHLAPTLRIWSIIRKEKVKLVHTNTLVCIDAALAAWVSGVPHIQHLREITGTSSDDLFRLKFQGTVFFKALYRVLNAKLICNSYFTLERSVKYFPKEKLCVLYNSVEAPSNIQPNKSKNTCTISSLANLTARMKNHQFILEVAKQVKLLNFGSKFKFHLHGQLPLESDSYFLALKQYVKSNGLKEIVFFIGQGKTNDILNETDILIHSYAGESFGRIFIEAMSYGIPIFSVKGGGATELVEPNITGFLFDPAQTKECALTLIALLDNPTKYNEMSESGKLFSQKFLPENIFPQLLKIYQTVLAA